MLGASIISQTLQKGSVGFLENDVKLFCMLLFARCLLWCQSSRVIAGESIERMKFVFKCLYLGRTISPGLSCKLWICWRCDFYFYVRWWDWAESGLMSAVIRLIKSQENMCHCPDFFFQITHTLWWQQTLYHIFYWLALKNREFRWRKYSSSSVFKCKIYIWTKLTSTTKQQRELSWLCKQTIFQFGLHLKDSCRHRANGWTHFIIIFLPQETLGSSKQF